MFQIEAAGFVIAETLFDARSTGIVSKARPAGDLIGADRHHFGLPFLIRDPSDRDIGLQLGFTSQQNVLKIAVAVDGHPVVQAVRSPIWQGDVGVTGDAHGVIPA